MRHLITLGLGFSLLLGLSEPLQAFDYDLASMKASFRDLTLKAAERKNCMRYNKAGKIKGERFFYQLFPSCTDLLLAGGTFQSFFNPNVDYESRTDTCFESGYREAFVRASATQWIPCMKELGAALESTNAQSVEECKKLGQDSIWAMNLISNEGFDPAREEQSLLESEEYARIVFFADNGFGQEVWQSLVRLGQERQEQIFSCNLAFSTELFKGSL